MEPGATRARPPLRRQPDCPCQPRAEPPTPGSRSPQVHTPLTHALAAAHAYTSSVSSTLQLPQEDGWDSPTPLSRLTHTLLAHNSPHASPRIQFLSRRPLLAQTNPRPQRRFFRNDTSAQHKHPRSLLGNLLTPSA
jgi:hypothetical protein